MADIIIASREAPAWWQEHAEVRCSDAVKDIDALVAATYRAQQQGRGLTLSPGAYHLDSPWVVEGDQIKSVRGAGQCYLRSARGYDGWIMRCSELRRAEVAGLGFTGQGTGCGMLIHGCHDSTFARLHMCNTPSAIHLSNGWCTYFDALRVDWCGNAERRLAGPLVEMHSFSGHLRGLAMTRNHSQAPSLVVDGTAEVSNVAIERSQSEGPIVQFSGRHSRVARLHFEGNKAPVQVRAVDCRQCEITGLSLGGSESSAVEVGVLVERSQQTRVDGVIVTHCRDAVVRIGPKCVGCEAERIDLHYPRERYRQHGIAPRHLVDVVGSRQ